MMADEEKHGQARISSIQDLRMFILDVIRHDGLEQVSGMVELLNDRNCIGWREFWPRDFTAEEIWMQLKHLCKQGLIDALIEQAPEFDLVSLDSAKLDALADSNQLWFALTDAGRRAWEQWAPPTSVMEQG
ncbi:MAG: hypothetical protein WD894_09975 [Pirellulales bacterium]